MVNNIKDFLSIFLIKIRIKIYYSLYFNVLIVNPKVGEISLTSSPIIDFTIVVFPELSKPLLYLFQYKLQYKQSYLFFH